MDLLTRHSIVYCECNECVYVFTESDNESAMDVFTHLGMLAVDYSANVDYKSNNTWKQSIVPTTLLELWVTCLIAFDKTTHVQYL